jgi:manganese oxidase
MVRAKALRCLLWNALLGLSLFACAPAVAVVAPTESPTASPADVSPVGPVTCTNANTVTARVVALDMVLNNNRFGATQPGAMIFALALDVRSISDPGETNWEKWEPGDVELQSYKRPRPLALRVNKGQCLKIQFRNLLSTTQGDGTATRSASVHVQGMDWVDRPQDDGSWVGTNANTAPESVVQPMNPGDPTITYTLFAAEEGPFLLYSTADDFTGGTGNPGGGDGGQLTQGLFGAVVVQPAGAEYYRSQVTYEELCLSNLPQQAVNCVLPTNAPPKIDYQAAYPSGSRQGLPILNMIHKGEIVHSDLTAVITGKGAQGFPQSDATLPTFHKVDPTPNRLEPYREFVLIYHEMLNSTQAFTGLYAAPQLKNMLESVGDNFAINYGMGGIGSEVLANRLKVGPTANCVDCKYEEFFLSSWPNGDPAMIVDRPADTGCTMSGTTDYTTYNCPTPTPTTKATRAYYPDDPSNVYHSYLWDHTKFRILHAGVDLHHLHHLHAHQWLHSPNSSNGHYLDSQAIGPGSAFTLETVHNGGGNKNLTVGDSIFHCHFYPHFAAGMWALWRVHDVLEEGTQVDAKGRPLKNSRALPDGEIVTGVPTVALVPIPTKPMAPMPAPVRLTANGSQIEVCTDATFTSCVSNLQASGDPTKFKNPGFPFFIPGIGGSRAAHPPLDLALACSGSGAPCPTFGAACAGGGGTCDFLDGGLPRHLVQTTGGTSHAPAINPLDMSKEILTASAFGVPETGTLVEQIAMAYHATKFHPTVKPDGAPAQFRTNGRKPISGAPYAEPCIDIEGNVPAGLQQREYWAVDIQTQATYNKEGSHYPQQRMLSLWGDAFDFMGLTGGKPKAPEPFFIRANANDCVKYVLANLVPNVYELDDFQVRTPTDILGQHIHLVKFDVTSSDGAGNGFNYEDGTFGPNEVTERINAFNNGTFVPEFGSNAVQKLKPEFIKFFGADPECATPQPGPAPAKCNCQAVEYQPGKWTIRGGRWCGAQATVQRWYVDPTLNDVGEDLTFRTVFTHDHFGPSTNQQTGLYAALVSEPEKSIWRNNETGAQLGVSTVTQNGVTLKDGGKTSWQAVIETANKAQSFREFLFGFQDSGIFYRPFPDAVTNHQPAGCPAGQACGFCSNDHSVACVTDASSPSYYKTVCKDVELPIPNTASTTTLEKSCNYIPGLPAKNNLFYISPTSPATGNNIWGVTTLTPEMAKIGWDTLPISPPPKGLVVTGTQNRASQPEGITFNGASTNFSVNYRNEPVYPRFNSTGSAPNGQDTAFVYSSLTRTLPGAVPDPYNPLTPGVQPGDPYTPLLRAYEGDDVQVRIVVGAHQNPHNFTLHGNKWLFEPSNVNSGWRNTQTMGISEHFEFLFKLPPTLTQPGEQKPSQPWTDYLYKPTSARIGVNSGNWGLLRSYSEPVKALQPLPQNPPSPGPRAMPVCPQALLDSNCQPFDAPGGAPIKRCFDIIAASTADLGYSNSSITYNSRLNNHTPNALLYLHRRDYDDLLNPAKKKAPGYDPATGLATPLVLRAAAGDCLQVKLTNKLKASSMPTDAYLSGQLPVAGINPTLRELFAPSKISQNVGLRPQLVTYNAAQSDGANVGFNPTQTVGPDGQITYYWYAGNLDPAAKSPHIPVELGASNLLPADPVNHHQYALFGALVIGPAGASFKDDPNSRASATVTRKDGSKFRDFVLITQDDAYVLNSSNARVSGIGAVNLRSEPLSTRSCPSLPTGSVACVLSNSATCGGSGTCGASQTPIFCAQKGQEAHLHLLHPGGAVTSEVFELHGHAFAEEPYWTPQSATACKAPLTQTNVYASQVVKVGNQCPDGNVALGPTLSEWKGVRTGHGPTNHFDVVIGQAGGVNQVAGDYLYRTYPANHFANGMWGIFRVLDDPPVAKYCPSFEPLQ